MDNFTGRYRQAESRRKLADIGLVHDRLAERRPRGFQNVGGELTVEHERRAAVGETHRQLVELARQCNAQTVRLGQQGMHRQYRHRIAQLRLVQTARRAARGSDGRGRLQAERARAVPGQARQQREIIALGDAKTLGKTDADLSFRQQIAEHGAHAIAVIGRLTSR